MQIKQINKKPRKNTKVYPVDFFFFPCIKYFLFKLGYLQHLISFQFNQPFTRSISSSIYWQTVKHTEGSLSYPAINIYLQKYRCVHFWVHISLHVDVWMHKNGESGYIYITEKISVGYKKNSCSHLPACQNAMLRDNYTRSTSRTL